MIHTLFSLYIYLLFSFIIFFLFFFFFFFFFLIFFFFFFFFFSSRRRHTRSLRDWSSDVCSSDLCSPCLWVPELFRTKYVWVHLIRLPRTCPESERSANSRSPPNLRFIGLLASALSLPK